MRNFTAIVLTLAYAATILAANWAIQQFGIISVGFGLQAPAAVVFAGLAFTFRDLVHEAAGRAWAAAAIVIGAGLSALLANPQIAFASGAAFLLSEGLDLLVYERVRARGWLTAVAVSNAFGFVTDSVVFLWLAFGSLAFLPGQLVGKAYMTLAAVVVLAAARRWARLPDPVEARAEVA